MTTSCGPEGLWPGSAVFRRSVTEQQRSHGSLESARMLIPARMDAVASAPSGAVERAKAAPLETWIVGGIVVIGAVLRFATLGNQSYWADEAETAHLLSLSLGGMLSVVVPHEANPPLYFVLGWVWVKVFGSAEVGLRSLSALAGTAVIPIAYLCGRELVSKSAGILAAALAAVSPFMLWYSQEGTEYMLLAAMSGASLLYFARALRKPSTKNIVWWGVFSALALLTHFFAVFLVAPEAVWLIYSVRRRSVLVGMAPLLVSGAALIPLVVSHASTSLLSEVGGFITETPLRIRIEQVPVEFGLGTLYKSSLLNYGLLGAAVVAGVLIVLLVIGASSQQIRGAGVAAAMAGVVLLAPLVLALLGHDYYLVRALIPAWIPLAVVVGAACTARRTLVPGLAFASVLLAMFVYAQVRIDRNPQYQRPDWRAVAHALGSTRDARAIVVYQGGLAVAPLSYYLPRVAWDVSPRTVQSVNEVDVVANIWQPSPRLLPPGTRLLARRSVAEFVVDRFRVTPAWRVTPAEIAARAGQLVSSAPPERAVVIQNSAKP